MFFGYFNPANMANMKLMPLSHAIKPNGFVPNVDPTPDADKHSMAIGNIARRRVEIVRVFVWL